MNDSVNFFNYNGINYYAGTIVKFESGELGRYRGYGDGFDLIELKDGKYTDTNRITFGRSKTITKIILPITFFDRKFEKVQKDTQNDDMFYAWILYIVYMLFISITTDAILGWIVGTIIFIVYRHKRLYKEVNKR